MPKNLNRQKKLSINSNILKIFLGGVLFLILLFLLEQSYNFLPKSKVNIYTSFKNPPTSKTIQQSDSIKVLSASEIYSNKEKYAGKKVKVAGRIYFKLFESEMPCSLNTGEGCNNTSKIEVSIVDSSASSNIFPGDKIINLYKSSNGQNKPYTCFGGPNTTDCGIYKKNAATVIEGMFIKDKAPYQIVGNSSGKMEVVKYQDIYYLLVE